MKKKLRPREGAPNINKTTWLYVEDNGLCVVHRGDIFHLPWKAVRLAVDAATAAARPTDSS